MSSVPAGKRSWKCPECGGEVLLSMTQLDPLACDACLAKMKSGHKSGTTQGIAGAIAGPLGIWQALPETTKLGLVFVALVIGLLIGYVAGKATPPEPIGARTGTARTRETTHSNSTTADDDSTSKEILEDRPDPPGPGYKWVQGRKHKDGTRGSGHWAKDPHYKGDDDSGR
jgi:hypothetical protein